MYHEFVIPITARSSFTLDFYMSGIILMWIALFLTLWSGIDYFVKFYITSTSRDK